MVGDGRKGGHVCGVGSKTLAFTVSHMHLHTPQIPLHILEKGGSLAIKSILNVMVRGCGCLCGCSCVMVRVCVLLSLPVFLPIHPSIFLSLTSSLPHPFSLTSIHTRIHTHIQVPRFVKILAKDYERWSRGDDSRDAVAADEEERLLNDAKR